MENCIFCKIVRGEIPSNKVYEDADIVAFLDIAPVNIGHTLIIPKEHFVNIYETPDEILSSIMKLAKKLATIMKTTLSADGVNVTMNNDPASGQVVFHSHVHVIPRVEGDGFGLWHGKRPYNEGEAKEVAQKITAGL